MLVPLDMPDANSKISNLKQATTEYVAEYNVCKCKPCHNGATLALLDGKCICLCPHLYEGMACQNFKSKPPGKGKQNQYHTYTYQQGLNVPLGHYIKPLGNVLQLLL